MAVAAIVAMAAATALMRLGANGLMATVPLTRRVRRMLDALPGSVIVATDRAGRREQWRARGAWRRGRRWDDDAAPKEFWRCSRVGLVALARAAGL